jgi:abequosyltransferase
MKNKKLAIAIPTYNRASIVKENILLMLNEIKRYSIPLYISDDSNNEETKLVVVDLKKEYDYIYYYKNQPGLGHDKNCIRTLALPNEEYIWYLGDSIIIEDGGIKKVLDVIETTNYDFISVNTKNRNLDLTSRRFDDGNILMLDLGWHLTMSGVTIYSNKIQTLLGKLDLVKCKNFPQTALIFESFVNDTAKLFWINDNVIYGNKRKKSYWSSAIFDVFLIDWNFFITSLPNFYLDQNKMYVIKKHSEKTGLFTFMRFLDYRSQGIFSVEILKKYFGHIRFNSNVNIILLMLISLTPKWVLIFLKQIFYPGRLQ